jgi:hypothetical protein
MVISVAVRIRGRLGPDLLRKALAAVQRRHPLLRAHIPATRELRFEWRGTTGIPVEVIPRKDERHWHRVMEETLHHPIPPGPHPRLRVQLLQPAQGDLCELVAGWDHALGDASSVVTFARDLLEAAAAIAARRPLRPNWELPRPPPLDAVLPVASEHRPRGVAGVRLLLARLAGSRFPHAFAESRPSHRRTAICNLALSPAAAFRMLERCRAERTTVHGLFAAATLGAARALGVPSGVSCSSTVDLRSACKPPVSPEAILAGVGMVVVDCPIEEPFDLWELARLYRARTREAVERGEAAELVNLRLNRLQEAFALRLLPRLRAGRVTGVSLANAGRAERPRFPGFELLELYAATSQHVLGNFLSVSFFTVGEASCLSFEWVEPLIDRKQGERWAHQTRATLEAAAAGKL